MTIRTTWETLVRAAARRAPERPADQYELRCVELDQSLWRGWCRLEAEIRLGQAESQRTRRGHRWWRAGARPYTFEVVEVRS